MGCYAQLVVELAGVQEVSDLLSVSRQRVHQLAASDDFPAPIAKLAAGVIWDREEIVQWKKRMRSVTDKARVVVPPRDPERPQDDPWDADAVRCLLGTPEGKHWTRGDLMECLREQRNRVVKQPRRVEEARRLAATYGVERRPHTDDRKQTVHFYRTDPGAPAVYPSSAHERRSWLQS